jgi:hypothetical protein
MPYPPLAEFEHRGEPEAADPSLVLAGGERTPHRSPSLLYLKVEGTGEECRREIFDLPNYPSESHHNCNRGISIRQPSSQVSSTLE